MTHKLSDEEMAQVLQKGIESEKKINDELENMHPKAREARLRDFEIHPDRNPPKAPKKEGWTMYNLVALNMINQGDPIEFISPDVVATKAKAGDWMLLDPETGCVRTWVCDSHPCVLYTKEPLQDGALIRIEDPEYQPGIIRDSGR